MSVCLSVFLCLSIFFSLSLCLRLSDGGGTTAVQSCLALVTADLGVSLSLSVCLVSPPPPPPSFSLTETTGTCRHRHHRHHHHHHHDLLGREEPFNGLGDGGRATAVQSCLALVIAGLGVRPSLQQAARDPNPLLLLHLGRAAQHHQQQLDREGDG